MLTEEQVRFYSERGIKLGIHPPEMTHEEYVTARDYIARMLQDSPVPPFTVWPDFPAAYGRVCDLASETPEQREYLWQNPVIPSPIGCFDQGLIQSIEAIVDTGGTLSQDCLDYRCLGAVYMVWTLRKEYVFLRPQPTFVNDAGELHREDGPALDAGEGYRFWFINGVECDEQIVMRPKTQTLEQILQDDNEDRRSIRIDRYGWVPFLGLIKAKAIDERSNDVEGTYEVLYETPYGNRLVPTCPTGAIPSLGVPNHIRTCEEAQQWLHRDLKGRICIART